MAGFAEGGGRLGVARYAAERAKPWADARLRFAAAVGASADRAGWPAASPAREASEPPAAAGSSTRALRCSRPAGERQTRGPTFGRSGREAFALATPRMAGISLRELPMLGPQTDGARRHPLRRMAQPAGRCAPRRRKVALPAARPRLCENHGGPCKAVGGCPAARLCGGEERSSGRVPVAVRRRASAVCSRSERRRLAQQDDGRARRPPSLRSRLRGPGQPQAGPRVWRWPARCEHRRVRVDEAKPRLTDRSGAAGSPGRRFSADRRSEAQTGTRPRLCALGRRVQRRSVLGRRLACSDANGVKRRINEEVPAWNP